MNRPQQVRRVAKPSSELETLLQFVNEIPSRCSSTRRMYEETEGPGAAWEYRFEAEIEALPDRVRNYIGLPRNSGESFVNPDAQARYNRLVQARAILLFVALQNQQAMHFAPEQSGPDRHRQTLAAYWRSFPLTSVNLINATLIAEWIVTAKNELRVVTIPGIEELKEVDYLRIRHCPRCMTLFFAGRLQQSACPEPCAHILRTLRWREGYQAKYKQQRIEKANAQEAQTKAQKQVRRSSGKGGK